MTSILNLKSSPPVEVEPQNAIERDTALETPPEATDYEIVLGRSQIASWLFVALIVVAVSSSLAYLLGETIGVKKTARVSAVTRAATPVPAAPTAGTSAPPPEASIVVPSKVYPPPIVKTSPMAVAPLFAEPEIGKVYLQVGAVERGMAMLLAEGLRSHGFDSFVAPGPHENLFRVLIGPVLDPQAFRQTMAAVEALDLAVYARKYQK
jgi:cell division septation protein DedD